MDLPAMQYYGMIVHLNGLRVFSWSSRHRIHSLCLRAGTTTINSRLGIRNSLTLCLHTLSHKVESHMLEKNRKAFSRMNLAGRAYLAIISHHIYCMQSASRSFETLYCESKSVLMRNWPHRRSQLDSDVLEQKQFRDLICYRLDSLTQ